MDVEDDGVAIWIVLHLAEVELERGSTAAAQSESWIARNWRPITMLSFVFIIFNNFVLVPYGEAFGFPMPSVMLPPDMFALLKIGLGGYVVGRSAEKGIKLWKAKQA